MLHLDLLPFQGDNTVKDSSLTIWFSEQELDDAPWYLWLLHRIIRDPMHGRSRFEEQFLCRRIKIEEICEAESES